MNGVKYSIIVIITLLVCRPVRQHFIEPLDYCVLSKICNHTWVPECAAQYLATEFVDLKMFTDLCDMYEYNCDNSKEYDTVDYSKCFPPTFPPQFHRVGNYKFHPSDRKAIYDPTPASASSEGGSQDESHDGSHDGSQDESKEVQNSNPHRRCNKEEPRMSVKVKNYYNHDWISDTRTDAPKKAKDKRITDSRKRTMSTANSIHTHFESEYASESEEWEHTTLQRRFKRIPSRTTTTKKVTSTRETATKKVTPATETTTKKVNPTQESTTKKVTTVTETTTKKVTPTTETTTKKVIGVAFLVTKQTTTKKINGVAFLGTKETIYKKTTMDPVLTKMRFKEVLMRNRQRLMKVKKVSFTTNLNNAY